MATKKKKNPVPILLTILGFLIVLGGGIYFLRRATLSDFQSYMLQRGERLSKFDSYWFKVHQGVIPGNPGDRAMKANSIRDWNQYKKRKFLF